MSEEQLQQDTYEVTAPDSDKIAHLAREHDLTEQEVIEQMVREYSTMHDEGWVIFNERIDQLDPTESLSTSQSSVLIPQLHRKRMSLEAP